MKRGIGKPAGINYGALSDKEINSGPSICNPSRPSAIYELVESGVEGALEKDGRGAGWGTNGWGKSRGGIGKERVGQCEG